MTHFKEIKDIDGEFLMNPDEEDWMFDGAMPISPIKRAQSMVLGIAWEKPIADQYPVGVLQITDVEARKQYFVSRYMKDEGTYMVTGESPLAGAKDLNFLVTHPRYICWRDLSTFGKLPAAAFLAGRDEPGGEFYVGCHKTFGIGKICRNRKQQWIFCNETVYGVWAAVRVLCLCI